MRPDFKNEAERWLAQAERDFDDANFAKGGKRYNLACFLYQQSAEKAVKAYLYSRELEEIWGHSAAELCNEAKKYNKKFTPPPESHACEGVDEWLSGRDSAPRFKRNSEKTEATAVRPWSFTLFMKDAASLDKFYIPTRYPNGLPGGIPSDVFQEKDAKILSSLERALADKELKEGTPRGKKRSILDHILHKEETYHDLVGKSEKAREIYSIIERISNAKTTILLQGESGTGKRMIAHAIHKADNKRRNKPFIEISCGALPREIIESELFGHTKGAFTGAVADRKGRFELADGGTLLLDDIDSLPLDLQVKLLRVIQHKEFERIGDHRTMKVDLRIVATTNQDIKTAVLEKRFREDLYYRINVISLQVPPLRERKEDLPLFVSHFINFYARENHKKIGSISEEAMQVLMDYSWPGNIRELENIIERAIILDTDNTVDTDDLPEIILKARTPGAEILKNIASTLKEALQEPEKVHILQVLKEVGWNKNKAASKLGVNRTTLYNKLRKYKIREYEK